jgi:mRNA-degrading endonuclease RelE of RelBE toxin-antitoxin system
MLYSVILTDEVKAQLRRLPANVRREIGHKLFLLEDHLTGDVQKLRRSKKRIPIACWQLSSAF